MRQRKLNYPYKFLNSDYLIFILYLELVINFMYFTILAKNYKKMFEIYIILNSKKYTIFQKF